MLENRKDVLSSCYTFFRGKKERKKLFRAFWVDKVFKKMGLNFLFLKIFFKQKECFKISALMRFLLC